MRTVGTKRTYLFMEDLNAETTRKLFNWLTENAPEDPEELLSIQIGSGGGSVPAGFAITDFITTFKKIRIQTIAFGTVASMAVPIFLCGEERIINPRAQIFLHQFSRSFSATAYQTSEIRGIATILENQERIYSEFISERCGGKLSPSDILGMMRKETLILPQEALELGFTHEIAS